jgi:hypothetical protein
MANKDIADISILIRATRNCSQLISVLKLQKKRMFFESILAKKGDLKNLVFKQSELDVNEFRLSYFWDFQFFIIAVYRIRNTIKLALKIKNKKIVDSLRTTMNIFDIKLPWIEKLRNASEHFDDYAIDEGREKTVRRGQLEVCQVENGTFYWLGEEVSIDDTIEECQELYKKLKEATESK